MDENATSEGFAHLANLLYLNGFDMGKVLIQTLYQLRLCSVGDRIVEIESFEFHLKGTVTNEKTRVCIGSTEAPAEIVNITSLTGGEVFTAGERASLHTVFEKIDSMQQTEFYPYQKEWDQVH